MEPLGEVAETDVGGGGDLEGAEAEVHAADLDVLQKGGKKKGIKIRHKKSH